MNLHYLLKEKLEMAYAATLDGGVVLNQDALTLQFVDGPNMEVRFLDADQYSIQWRWGEALLRIDTAPLHPELATFPNHLHDAVNQLYADHWTTPGAEPWENLQRLIDSVLKDPLLNTHISAGT